MNEQEKTLAAYKEYLLECANNGSLDYSGINKKYEFKGVNDECWIPIQESTYIVSLYSKHIFRLKKRTVVVNGQTVPAPMDRGPKLDERYYHLDSHKQELVNWGSFNNHSNYDKRMIRAGWFVDEQDASEYFKALLGIE